jgi:hypothetical protein
MGWFRTRMQQTFGPNFFDDPEGPHGTFSAGQLADWFVVTPDVDEVGDRDDVRALAYSHWIEPPDHHGYDPAFEDEFVDAVADRLYLDNPQSSG